MNSGDWVSELCCYFLFFKQKTAYEVRISDWSSDVCSSDLWPQALRYFERHGTIAETLARARLYGEKAKQALDIFPAGEARAALSEAVEIGRASCRERVCQYV